MAARLHRLYGTAQGIARIICDPTRHLHHERYGTERAIFEDLLNRGSPKQLGLLISGFVASEFVGRNGSLFTSPSRVQQTVGGAVSRRLV
jgi:hypothetical protein